MEQASRHVNGDAARGTHLGKTSPLFHGDHRSSNAARATDNLFATRSLALANHLGGCHPATRSIATWVRKMNGTSASLAHEDPADSAAVSDLAARATGIRLLSAADIWSSGVETPPPTSARQPEATVEVRALAAPPTRCKSTRAGAERIASDIPVLVLPQAPWPPRRLSLALQGGGSFSAFTWGVLDRLLEEDNLDFDTISGASAGAVNAVVLACGLAQGGREGARALLLQFWTRMMNDGSFRAPMLIGGFSPAGSSVAFSPALRSGQLDPFDLDPLRQLLATDIDFGALRAAACPKLLIGATRIRDGRQQIFRNHDITADVVLASTCPPLVHCAVEIDGESYWDGGYSANPPLLSLARDCETSDLLVVQVTPSRDHYVPITMAAIDRRVDQIVANATLNAEIAALEWARTTSASPRPLEIHLIAAEDHIEGLGQRNASDLGHGFVTLLHRSGRSAAHRWLKQTNERTPAPRGEPHAPRHRAVARAVV
jgi:NTE family protein